MSCFHGEDAFTKADAVFNDMRQRGVMPDAFTYNALLNAALRSRAPEQFRRVIAQMEESGVQHTSETERCFHRLQVLESESSRVTDEQGGVSLPDGWHATLDPKSGHHYYWRRSDPSGTVTWQ